jgi:hypothetical protein
LATLGLGEEPRLHVQDVWQKLHDGRSHYQLVTEYDDGFYDCTRGTCPEGHRRMVDD